MASALQNRIMRRVYVVSYLRRILSPLAVKLYASIVILWAIGKEVWVSKVIENSGNTSVGLINFYASALWNAHLAVQVLVLAFAAVGVWFIKDIFSPAQSRLSHSII